MSESGDFDPGPWKGYDFDSVAKSFDRKVASDRSSGRSYSGSSRSSSGGAPRLTKEWAPKSLHTDATSVLVVVTDHTGSMGDWPGIMVKKMGYLEHEAQVYLGKDLDISFSAIGDAYSDQAPWQVRPFTRGLDLNKQLEELYIEGNGGGGGHESYELAALYYARCVEMPKAIRPILIFIADEQPYDLVDQDQALKHAHVSIDKSFSSDLIFHELKQKFSVWLIHKPYGYGGRDDQPSEADLAVLRHWNRVVGADYIRTLAKAERVVDVIFGILGEETGKVDYFEKELKERQTPEQVDTVMKALKTVHKLPAPSGAGHSVMRGGDSGTATKPLI